MAIINALTVFRAYILSRLTECELMLFNKSKKPGNEVSTQPASSNWRPPFVDKPAIAKDMATL